MEKGSKKPILKESIDTALKKYNDLFIKNVMENGSGDNGIKTLLCDFIHTLEEIKQVCIDRNRF